MNTTLTVKPGSASDGFERVRLSVAHGQDIHFVGRVIAEYTTQNSGGTKNRWTELRVWQTEGGAWIAESVGASDAGREIDIVEATVIDADTPEQDKRLAVMAAFNWTTAAKAMARLHKWDVRRVVL